MMQVQLVQPADLCRLLCLQSPFIIILDKIAILCEMNTIEIVVGKTNVSDQFLPCLQCIMWCSPPNNVDKVDADLIKSE